MRGYTMIDSMNILAEGKMYAYSKHFMVSWISRWTKATTIPSVEYTIVHT